MTVYVNDFFKMTEEEIRKSDSDGKFTAEHGKTYKFTVKEIREKDKVSDEGEPYKMMIIVLGEAGGLEHTLFVNSNRPKQIKDWMNLVRCFYTDDQLKNGLQRTAMISKVFTAVAEVNDYNGKKYINLKAHKAVSNVPDVGGQTVTQTGTTDIPF